ncbi:MAG: hypothetical protein QNJ89_15270 [Acidimicrobiia bacterium]|nr:hypothetical protein [Acidimicrobiia bacterium]
MRKYLGIGAAWLGATVLSVLIASAAVAGIRDRVVETPVAIGAPTSTTTTVVGEATTSTEAPSTTVAVPSTTTSSTATTTLPSETPAVTVTAPSESTTTTPPAPPPTTTTAAPPTTTTTTTPPTTTTTAPISYSTHDLIGGTVVLASGNGQVNLVSATPRPGFSVEAEHTGPDEVEVKFESNDHKSELEAYFRDGELRVETEEEPHGGEEE